MISLERGDVILVWFPNSDLKTFKRRPALVVQADALNTGIAQVVLAMITSNLSRRNHPSRVFITLQSPQAHGTGLRTDSVVMTDNLATVVHQAIAEKIGHLADLSEVNRALRATLGL
ncbi:MAG: type II toxin-antitoxin system PemK/MazF family toxin [Verrucomicrobia bacterium]|nr:type II toxin-antitoxin system PemK/MazF family toxin [Verrucomicrobiota bacterium]